MLRLRIPDLTEERRKDLIKILKNLGEKGKIAIRNIRREANEDLKKIKDKTISEDNKLFEKNIQKLTDNNIENIQKILEPKKRDTTNEQTQPCCFYNGWQWEVGQKKIKEEIYSHLKVLKS